MKTKPQIAWQLASDTVINDSVTKKISIIGMFDDINISTEANSVYLPFCIISRIRGIESTEQSKLFKTEIYDPDGEKFSETIVASAIPQSNINLVSRFPLKEISKIGSYRVKVSIDGVEVDNSNGPVFNVKKKQPANER